MFSKVSLQSLSTLLDALVSYSDHSLEFIRTIYERKAQHLSENVTAAEALNLIKRVDNTLDILEDVKARLTDDNTKTSKFGFLEELVFERLFSAGEPIRKELDELLKCFRYAEGNYILIPRVELMRRYGPLRDFLIELGVVHYDENRRCFCFCQAHISHLIDRCKWSNLSPKELKCLLEQKEQLGFLAEQLIMESERALLSKFPALSEKVYHISLINSAAGYDIESFEIPTGSSESAIKKYIEVKAVSGIDWRFYWSRNEISAAEKYNKSYNLYLVPVGARGKLSVERTVVIRNPYHQIFIEKDLWEPLPNSYEVLSRDKNL